VSSFECPRRDPYPVQHDPFEALLLVPWVLTLRRGGLVAGGSSRRG
jgi:hypothetical protein